MKRHIYSPRSYDQLFNFVQKYGDECSPRGEATIEVINPTLIVKKPTNRIVTDRGRKMNIGFAIAEFFSTLLGIDDIRLFTRFISSFDRFSSDGEKLDGTYGTRIVSQYRQHPTSPKDEMVGREINQVAQVIEKLVVDKYTRRAVIQIYTAEDLFGLGGTNTPCTLTMQFLIRDEKLMMIVNMRSSDIYLGVPYDVFNFTMLQEHVFAHLKEEYPNLQLGEYIHNAGSLHFYKSDVAKLEKIGEDTRWPFSMGPMPCISIHAQAGIKSAIMEWLNTDKTLTEIYSQMLYDGKADEESYSYVLSLFATMDFVYLRGEDSERRDRAYSSINDTTLKYAANMWS